MRRIAHVFGLAALAAFAPVSARADSAVGDHAEDVVDYTLRASLDVIAHTVHGEGKIVWRNTSAKPVGEIWLHLYMNAFKNERSVWLSEPVGGFRGGGGVRDWGTIDVRKLAVSDPANPEGFTDEWPKAELKRAGGDDETDVRVPLPHEVAPNESIEIETTWDVKLPSVVERTGYDGSFHMVAQWFPKIARLEPDGTFAHFPFHRLSEFYSDFGTYDVTLDVPQGFVVGATGPAVETKDENGRHVERHVQTDVHDFAWTAWDKFRTRTEDVGTVHVIALYPPDHDAVVDRELETVRFAIPYFESRYGKYPYSVLTVVHPPDSAGEAGGMEYPTLITTGGSWLEPRIVLAPELVTVHEFGHQYFYGLIASNEMASPFLDEGVNSFAEEDALAVWKGPGSGGSFWGLSVSDLAAHMVNSRSQNAVVADPAYAFPTGASYGSLVYSRTATILETMKRVYGEDAYWRALADYTKKWRFRHPTPEDFVACFTDAISPEAGHELHTALFERGPVDYVVSDVSGREVTTAAGIFDEDGKRETLKRSGRGQYEGSILVSRRGPLHLPVDVDLVTTSGARERRTWDASSDVTRITYRGSEPLAYAIIDPDQKILLDENRTNNVGAIHVTGPLVRAIVPSAPRTLERLSYWLSLVVEALAP